MARLILRFFTILPLRLNHLIASLIGRLLYLFGHETKRIVTRNIELCFANLDLQQRKILIKKSLIEMSKAISESGFIWFRSFDNNAKYIKKVNGAQCLDEGKAMILLVPHFGCWEITARVVALDRSVTFLYKPLNDPAQENFLFSKRQQGNLSMASADKKGVIKLQRALSRGELIGILPDQDPGAEGGVVVPFFNVPANTMTLLARLAKKHDAKVVMGWSKRLKKGAGYHLNFKTINIDSKQDITADVSLMNQAIEELVRSCPEQYLWGYKRFKSTKSY